VAKSEVSTYVTVGHRGVWPYWTERLREGENMATLPDDFFTLATFTTLAGSAGITAAVTAALYKSAGWNPAKTGLAAAFLVVGAGLVLADRITDLKADVVGFFNAFLVYLSAAGLSDLGASKTRGGLAAGSRPWFRSWFR
jgi:hypothetical protein